MPTIEDYSNPKFIRYIEGATLTRNDMDRFMSYDDVRHYRNGSDSLQAGYNAQSPTVSIEKVNFRTDTLNIRRR
jgi:hypothetical protein